MAESARQDGAATGAEVVDLLEYVRSRESPPSTPEERDEFRRMWPLLMQMLREWDQIKASGGCPIARRILTPDD